MDGIAIRPMLPADVPAVMAIEFASYTMPWSEATFRGLLARADAELVVAERQGAVIGYAVLWQVVDQAELGNVAVLATERGRGIGGRLVRTALAIAARRGAREIFLEVRPSNATARELYHRLGFREVGSRRHYYSLPAEDALVMRRALDEPDTTPISFHEST